MQAKLSKLFIGLTMGTMLCAQSVSANTSLPGDDWLHVEGNKVLDMQGNEVWLTGANWFGFNASERVLHGLWSVNMDATIRAMANRGINLLRVPISTELIHEWQNNVFAPVSINNHENPELVGLNSLEIFDAMLASAKSHGMKVLLDMHSAEADNMGHIYPMWYKGAITPEVFYSTWAWMAARYANDDTLIAMDIENEPHGKPWSDSVFAKWDNSTDDNNWKHACETASNRILDENPNMLVMCEGIESFPKDGVSWNGTSDSDYHNNWWGGNLRAVRDFPIDLGARQSQFMYSPHDYGPLVFRQPWFYEGFNKDTLYEDVWKDNWMFIHEENISPLLIGEWGGFMDGGENETWMFAIRDLIFEHRLHHTFWCLNPNSGDTGGLLDHDWKTWDEQKYALLEPTLWKDGSGKYIGLDHQVTLGDNGTNVAEYYGNQVPAVSISTPANGAEVATGSSVAINFSLAKASGVNVYLNNSFAFTSTSVSQVSVSAPVAEGNFTVKLVAINDQGQEQAAEDSVTLMAKDDVVTNPAIDLQSPAANAKFAPGADISVQVSLQDASGFKVSLGGTNTNISGTSGTVSAPTTPGVYSLLVTAQDEFNNDLAATDSVSIEVEDDQSGGGNCEYIVQNEWNSGFVASIRITNNGSSVIDGWEVSWQYTDGSARTSGWNANVSGNNPYTATPLSWNSQIQPGSFVEFGVQGNKGTMDAPAPIPTVTGAVCQGGSDNRAPIASASASPQTGEAPLLVNFNGSGSSDPDGDTLSYSWNFGDGNTGSGETVSHTYTSTGNFTATLTVSDGSLTATETLPISVTGGNQPPIAQGSATPTSGDAPLLVSFSSVGSSDPDGDTLSFSWDFGDTNSSTEASPSHTYTSAGNYTAVLTVSDGSLTDEESFNITVSTVGNNAPDAQVSATPTLGQAPLVVSFDASASTDADNDPLTFSWNFGDTNTGNGPTPSHQYAQPGVYTATVTVSDGTDSDQASLNITVTDVNGGDRADNPFRGVQFYIDPVWSAKAAAEPGGDAIADISTAVWMDRIGAITDGIGLRGHLDNAVSQNAGLFMFVVYDLPNRDCAALASNGELRISENGFNRYKDEYIAPIVETLSDPAYSNLRIVAIVEVDSLPNLVTNLNEPDCAEANGPGGYRDGIRHALNQLSQLPNVYSYVDIAHSGWLGWDSNFGSAIDLIADVVESTDKGWDSVNGFVSNSANYTPVIEPFLPDPMLQVGGQPIRSADFYEFNNYLEEKSFVLDWRDGMIARGAPETLGMLIDTSRNGWGGAGRPTQVSTSTDVETYVNESRVDRREHRGNWCNQPGGVGYKPYADPYPGIDAFVWVKPPGESDGISDPDFEPDPNDPAKQHDPMCDPNAQNRYDPSVGTGATPNAPHAGRWYPEQFQMLVANAYPAVDEPAGPLPPPPPPPTDCDGLSESDPIVMATRNESVTVDLRCGPVYVRPVQSVDGFQFDNTGGEFNIDIFYNGTSKSSGASYSWSPGISGNLGTIRIERVDSAQSVKARWY